jgi:hypothetical protein
VPRRTSPRRQGTAFTIQVASRRGAAAQGLRPFSEKGVPHVRFGEFSYDQPRFMRLARDLETAKQRIFFRLFDLDPPLAARKLGFVLTS